MSIGFPNRVQDHNVDLKLREIITALNAATDQLVGLTASPPSGTFVLAKITPGGNNGSITISPKGLVTAWTAPT